MQTRLAAFIKDTPEGLAANDILRQCVHCGFCLATCPTYQLIGDELDSPRGRIYLMKQVFEGATATTKTQLHLDRCLTCRSCETTCPSGVNYSRLLDIGREVVERQVGRDPLSRLTRFFLQKTLSNPSVFKQCLQWGQWLKPLLPKSIQQKIPAKAIPAKAWPKTLHRRKVITLAGCVQPALSPATNAAAARVLDRLGITLLVAEGAGCCGALSFHLNARQEALNAMRRNIDAWWPLIEDGVEAIAVTASGCAVMVKDYGQALSEDKYYAKKAQYISDLSSDISYIILNEEKTLLPLLEKKRTTLPSIAFHAPCTLQHGLKQKGLLDAFLIRCGFTLTPVKDPHLCCGSAGTYALLQPKLSEQLRDNKITALTQGAPSCIVTANIGCQTHLQAVSPVPIRHWIEVLDEVLNA